MPRKRVKSKQKLIINYTKLTGDLYQSICEEVSMEELLDGSDYENTGYGNGFYYWMFDKKDIEMCKKIWKIHKDEVMKLWKLDKNNVGKRPFLWWKCEAPEPKKKIGRVMRYTLEKNPEGKSQLFYTDSGKLERVRYEIETEEEYLRRLDLLEDWEIKEFKKK
ncbi:MAG: hypothetical protein ACYDIA_07550 [Candidatus Humimicrobiaceae bacterium]